ncbi:GNAT family N-acetyltransferase [Vibrio sp. HN007]|uniref:GNAT family N-acetyltransferase n=1 Tax=Vibrio iocasae TaxID=3098914 RepID=UPI0035D41C49
MNNLVIREARLDDAKAMVELLQPIIDAGLTAIKTSSVEEQLEFIELFPKAGVFLVAIDGDTGKLLGMQDVMYTDESGVSEIGTFVDLEWRGYGIGHKLFTEIIRRLEVKNINQIKAIVQASNKNAVAFYSKLGFQNFVPYGDKVIGLYNLPD